MLVTRDYDRGRAVEYARRWAFMRNPLFRDYTGMGGNCTNFVSQAVYAGSCTMNFTPIFGWYYLSDTERAAAWTGVQFFYNFITGNRGVGPFGREVPVGEGVLGDVIQLGRQEQGYYHTLLIIGFDGETPLVAAQSDDAYGRALDTYSYDYARAIHIEGVRTKVPDTGDCFASVYDGVAIIPNETVPLPSMPQESPSASEGEMGGGSSAE